MASLNTRSPVHVRSLWIALPCSLLLAACGGSGGGSTVAAVEKESSASAGTNPVVPVESVSSVPKAGTPVDYEVVPGGSESVVVSWSAPTQRVGGQTLSMAELSGYRIYYGPEDSKTAFVVQVDDPYRFESTVEDLSAGTYFFSITAVDREGRESAPSNELSATVI